MIFYSEEKGHYSHMVRLVLAEKDISCEVKEFDPEGSLPDELPAINPYNKLPVLVDREVTIYEPRIILEYLDERFPHPPLLPIYPNEKAECKLLIHRIERDWLPLIDKMMDPKVSQKDFDKLKKELVSLVSGIVLVLKEKPYFMSDEFTLVDCYMSAILYRLPYLGVTVPDTKSFSTLRNYQKKLFSRSSFDLSLTDSERDLKYSFN
ncbi:MAG: glutathione S-transferase N-terminal domain-containing protein [Proteobacteria bacterium]|uniref:Glutathione S-transferase N-terminal domain-containing protein n=1 Tax=SAR86 cluster bacterium TaxID=2030880 RepID=A0A937IFI0_9GAMM|nr:glutathione S-transferase N-terminal domain-containing protein [SAR86 cluster bacterium]MBL6819649.1 glutathione S-transferase N-terminal domain-containing protein [SAR86 cluster bacterium]MDA0345716.1 glutathione S-transferase N-terminal domain-containing protein [Pseudomonadota bacterium]MDA1056564.1 glutathione S-transferase N-terminal domain-containing protein [Pseudomonadota bacterium]